MQQAAFTSALVVAYCRPFVETRNGAVLSMKLASYSDGDRELHAKLKSLRNSVYAHSDVELQRVRPLSIGGKATAIVSLPVIKLTHLEAKTLNAMIERTSKAIDKKLQSMMLYVADDNL